MQLQLFYTEIYRDLVIIYIYDVLYSFLEINLVLESI